MVLAGMRSRRSACPGPITCLLMVAKIPQVGGHVLAEVRCVRMVLEGCEKKVQLSGQGRCSASTGRAAQSGWRGLLEGWSKVMGSSSPRTAGGAERDGCNSDEGRWGHGGRGDVGMP